MYLYKKGTPGRIPKLKHVFKEVNIHILKHSVLILGVVIKKVRCTDSKTEVSS